MEQLRVAVVGLGALGRVHAANLSTLDSARLVRVHDTGLSEQDRHDLEAAGATCTDLAGALDPREVDAVIVATPTDSHTPIACQAIDNGIAVFSEKPLARTAAQARSIVEAAERHAVKVAVGHVVRYFPEYAAAHELVATRRMGPVASARLARLNAAPAAAHDWYADAARSGGVLLDMAIHDLDWCLWAFGPVERVFAVRGGDAGAQVASVTLRHTSGQISYLDASWRDSAFSTRLELVAADGLYRVDGSTAAGWQLQLAGATAGTYLPEVAPDPDDPFRLELQAALAWFAGTGPAPLATAADGYQAVRLAAAAIRSADTGTPVLLTTEDDA